MRFLFWTHPTALVALTLLGLGKGEWPNRWLTAGWIVAPVTLNSPMWALGSRLFGWQFGGLGGLLYFWFILPLNALLLGLAAPQFLHSRLFRARSEGVEFALGVLVEASILFANLAALSRVQAVVGNVAT